MKQLILSLILVVVTTVVSGQTQYVCSYGSAVYVSGPYDKPKVDIKTEKSKYGFYIDATGKSADYINLSFGTKSKVGLNGSSALMLVFTELAGGDNHFTATIFLKKNPDGTYPSAFSQHSWAEPAEFYRPRVSLGYCVQQ